MKPLTNHPPYRLDCGDTPANIHRDASHVPFLLVVDESGNTHHIYGLDVIHCKCGRVGEWAPGREALGRMLANRESRRVVVDLLLDELEQQAGLKRR